MKSAGVKGKKAKQQLLFGNVLCEQLRINAHQTGKKHERGAYSQIAGDILRKYRCVGKLAAEMQMNRNRLAKMIKKGVNMSKHRRMRTQMKLRHSVTKFLEREDNCRIQPGKRDATKVNGQNIQTRILTDYMANLHQKYLAENPEHKLSLATFCRMRPKHVRLTRCLGRNVCLCTKHQNMALKLQALRKHGLDIPQNPETFIKSDRRTVEKSKIPDMIIYPKWKSVTLENKKKKMKVVNIAASRDQFFEEWEKELAAFKVHYEIMTTQYLQTRKLKETLPENEIIIHMDFAENYSCKSANEIQSAYWNTTQYKLKRCSNKECCKQCRYVMFKAP